MPEPNLDVTLTPEVFIPPDTYFPTLVIGLGGTGNEVVRRMKRRLNAEFGETLLIQFLVVDTDTRSFEDANYPSLPGLETGERCLLDGNNAANIGLHLDRNPAIQERFPRVMDAQVLRRLLGCGQVRANGLLAFLANFRSFKRVLDARVDLLAGIDTAWRASYAGRLAPGASIAGNWRVYIISSVCGGNGAGIFLDVAFSTRAILAARQPRLTGILTLPSVYDTIGAISADPFQMKRIQANAYAALKELQFFMDDEGARHGLSLRYEDLPPVQIADPPFECCYLINRWNVKGYALDSHVSVYEMIAAQLAREIGSPVGAAQQSASVNDAVRQNLAPCPDTRRQRPFSTFANVSLVFPGQRIHRYCCLRKALEFADDTLLGSSLPREDKDGKIGEFLAAASLSYRGAKVHMPLDFLLTDPRRREQVYAELLLGEGLAQGRSRGEFAADVHRNLSNFALMDRAAMGTRIKETGTQLLAEATAVFDRYAARWIRAHGVTGAREILEHGVAVLKGTQREVEKEQDDQRREQDAAVRDQQDVKSLLVELEGVGFFGKWFRDTEELMRQVIHAYNRQIREEAEQLARPDIVRVIAEVQRQVEGQIATMKEVESVLTSLRTRLEAEVAQIEAHTQEAVPGFVLEMDIVTYDYYRQFYADHPHNVQEIAAGFFGEAADPLAVLRGQDAEALGNAILRVCAAMYGPEVKQKNIFGVAAEPAVQEDIGKRLEFMFGMCQPFWQEQGPPTPGFYYVDNTLLAVSDPDNPQVKRWIEEHKGQAIDPKYMATPTPIETSAPWSMALCRFTHGARVHYLSDAPIWKDRYREFLAMPQSHPHIAFGVEDLQMEDPVRGEEDRQGQAFALAMAFGLIARRGNYYYWNLGERTEQGVPVPYLRIPSESQCLPGMFPADTALTLKLPDSGLPVRPDDRAMLAQGREQAMAAFGRQAERVRSVEAYAERFIKDFGGNKFISLVEEYIKQALDPRVESDTDQYSKERAWLQDKVSAVHRG